MANNTILDITNLTKAFGGLQAMANVSYKMMEGELSAVIGPNGAGKSTFFNLISGYHKIDSGKVIFRDIDITEMHPHTISKLGISRAFQVSNIYKSLTVYENVRQAVLTYQNKDLSISPARNLARKETTEILESCRLLPLADVKAESLSQGDKKKLELGIVIGCSPKLLLLDEPTAGMSVEETNETIDLVLHLNQKKKLSILFTEHDMSVVFGCARRITVLHQGAIIADGVPEEVRANKKVQQVYLGEET
jgi:branched-chain amino acid transport system ATP-binding protein